MITSSTGRVQNSATESWRRSSKRCTRESRAEKLTERNKNEKRRNFGARSTLARCRRCNHLFSRPTTAPGDFATLLQSGGIQLLDLQTLTALRNDESVIRWGLSRMPRYQKLSDELIVPNLDQDISFFYDPATKKLRKRFEIYPEALEATVKFANDLERTHTQLLKRIQAERQLHR
jgi:hypothetical protein